MKDKLTREQSAHLISLGVPKEKAHDKISYGFLGYDPIFRLTDLLDILPKEIMLDKEHGLDFGWDFYANKWVAQYCDEDYLCLYEKAQYYAEELIDALYELLQWVLKNKITVFTRPKDSNYEKDNVQ